MTAWSITSACYGQLLKLLFYSEFLFDSESILPGLTLEDNIFSEIEPAPPSLDQASEETMAQVLDFPKRPTSQVQHSVLGNG